jgi:nicotinamidase-related amidase
MKNILIVVDMQNDFIYGKFSNKNAQNIVNPIFQEIEQNTVPYDKIIFTKDHHERDEFITISPNENKITYEGYWFASHCIDSADMDIVYPISKAVKYHNTTFGLKSQFDGSWRIMDILNECFPTEKEPYNIYICGVCTDICVLATAIGLTKYKNVRNITVLTDLCAGTSPKAHKTAVTALKSFGIETITIKQLKRKQKAYKTYTTTQGDFEW